MASRKPSSNGPGRGTPRSRTIARAAGRGTTGQRRLRAQTNDPAAPPTAPTRRSSLGANLTKRALALLVVGVVMMLSYASSLRVYLRQENQAATARAQIAAREAAISSLEEEIERWKDTNYVKAQARERLGWVMPGEIGYRVIGPDGKPLGGGASIQGRGSLPSGEHETTWWERLDGSIGAADAPVATGEQTTPPEITLSSSPTPTPSAAASASPSGATSSR